MLSLDNIAFVLILISALFKGIALHNLSNIKWDIAKRKKFYWRWNILCYIFLIPGAILLIYTKFFM